jgi:BirA family biotin operon repressor/biotin-[acetyl-CoA-carboxylase] ligase
MTESLKVKLLRYLLENSGQFVSGEVLANELSISRTLVWKAAGVLRSEGYNISASTKKGYRLDKRSYNLSETNISGHIKTIDVYTVDVRRSLTSTNTFLLKMAAEGAHEGFVLIAEEQTYGRGRQGKAFYSPAGYGVYFSVLLRPGQKIGDPSLITSASAVATAQAIEEVTGIKVGIKWVNDLFYNQKKVCGILTEATFDMESGSVGSVVLGIGINVIRPENGFQGALKEIATALLDNTEENEDIRCRLIAATLDNFWKYYQNLSGREFLEEYRKRSIVLGRDIYVLSAGERKPAHALAIDDECRLIVRYENGETATLNSGEVSIKFENR